MSKNYLPTKFFQITIVNLRGIEVCESLFHCHDLLSVSPEGGLSSVPTRHNVQRNTTVEFICLAEGGPGNVFTWTRLRDGLVLVNSSFLEVNVSGPFSGGLYECLVTNRAGNDTVQAILNGWYLSALF